MGGYFCRQLQEPGKLNQSGLIYGRAPDLRAPFDWPERQAGAGQVWPALDAEAVGWTITE